MRLKHIEITTVRFVFEDDEPNEEAKSTTDVQVFGNPEQPSKPKRTATNPAAKKGTKVTRRKWTEEDKADIIRRYQAGEGPKSIGDSLGVSRNAIQQIIHSAGVTEGRTGENLKKEEPQPEADENDPV